MNVSAIVMLVVALVILWGGLTLAIINLRRHPEEPDAAPDVDNSASAAARPSS